MLCLIDKSELISTLGEHPDHWCWCGNNNKGEWGIFPQAFIDPNSVYGGSADDRVLV